MDLVVEQLIDVLRNAAPDLKANLDGDALVVETNAGTGERTLFPRATLTPSMANRLIADEPIGMVIADVIHAPARRALDRAGWSYWDRRGHLRLWMPDIGPMLNDTTLRSFVTGADGPDPLRPVTGIGGISAALALLMAPRDPPGVRDIARLARMAPSTISRARQHLTEASLVERDGTPVVPELFWALSDAWVVDPSPVLSPPAGSGWVLGGEAAAARYGAPVLGTRERFYCSDRAAFDAHRLRHATSAREEASCEIAMAPTPVVNAGTREIVHAVVAALDLSRDSRGRESLSEWSSVASPPGSVGEEAKDVVWR